MKRFGLWSRILRIEVTSMFAGSISRRNCPTPRVRQPCLNSALLGNGDPKNILQEIPKNVEAGLSVYSPLWDVHMAMWTDNAIAGGSNRAQTDFDTIRSLVLQGLVTGPGGSEFGAANIIVNCPVISINHNHKR